MIHECDEKFWEEDLNEEGIEFTKYYYSEEREDGISYYLKDYSTILQEDADSLYELENTWENYHRLKPFIDKRYKAWKNNRNKQQ